MPCFHAESSCFQRVSLLPPRNLEFNELEDLPESLWKKVRKKNNRPDWYHMCLTQPQKWGDLDMFNSNLLVPGKHQNNVHIGMDSIISEENGWVTLPETNIAPEFMDGWNTIVSFWVSAYFQVRTVSFKECRRIIHINPWIPGFVVASNRFPGIPGIIRKQGNNCPVLTSPVPPRRRKIPCLRKISFKALEN